MPVQSVCAGQLFLHAKSKDVTNGENLVERLCEKKTHAKGLRSALSRQTGRLPKGLCFGTERG